VADPQQTLAQMVRAKYPGVYDDLSDADLEAKVKTKFPGVYDDIPTSQATSQTTTQTADQPASPTMWDRVKQAASETSPARVFTKENLPVIGGTLAALATDGASIPVTAALTGLGSAIGEGARQAVSGEPADPKKMLTQGAVQGGMQLAGGTLMGPVASALGKSAEDTMVKAFGSAGRNSGPAGAEALATVRKAAPELLKRGFKATSHADALVKIGDILDTTGTKLDGVLKSLPKDTAVPTQPIIDYLERSKGTITGASGVPVATGTDEIVNGILDKQIDKLKSLGASMSPDAAVQFRQSLGPLAKFSHLASNPENAAAEGYQIAYNGLREGLNQLSPEIGPINKELSLWIGLKKVLQKSAEKPQSGGTVGGLAGGALAAAHMGTGVLTATGTGGVVGAGVMGRYLQRMMQTPGWRFASSQVKDSLAKALANEDVGAVARITAQIAAGKATEAAQGVR
jgi:hypothetical protein